MSTFDVRPIQKIAYILPISTELAMEAGLIPDTRPPQPPPTRRDRFRWWRRQYLTAYGIRRALAAWIDPERDEW